MLRFSPSAWAKLLFLRDYGPSEVGGFGISAEEDPLRVEEIGLIRQSCTAVTVRFDDPSVADFFDEQVDRGRSPARFARIWIHTHPGESARPSGTDEETFDRCFGQADWAVMFILAQGGDTFARLRMNTGPGLSVEIPVEVDYAAPFPAADPAAWEREYLRNVTVTDRWESEFGETVSQRLSLDFPENGDTEMEGPFSETEELFPGEMVSDEVETFGKGDSFPNFCPVSR